MTRHERLRMELEDLKDEGALRTFGWMHDVKRWRLWTIEGRALDYTTREVEAFILGAFTVGIPFWNARMDAESS